MKGKHHSIMFLYDLTTPYIKLVPNFIAVETENRNAVILNFLAEHVVLTRWKDIKETKDT